MLAFSCYLTVPLLVHKNVQRLDKYYTPRYKLSIAYIVCRRHPYNLKRVYQLSDSVNL